jgi:hypothetical protein
MAQQQGEAIIFLFGSGNQEKTRAVSNPRHIGRAE